MKPAPPGICVKPFYALCHLVFRVASYYPSRYADAIDEIQARIHQFEKQEASGERLYDNPLILSVHVLSLFLSPSLSLSHTHPTHPDLSDHEAIAFPIASNTITLFIEHNLDGRCVNHIVDGPISDIGDPGCLDFLYNFSPRWSNPGNCMSDDLHGYCLLGALKPSSLH